MKKTNKELGIHPRTKNELGNRYGRLTVIEEYFERVGGRVAWLCECDCGNTTIVVGKYLRNGDTQSCGCLTSKGERSLDIILTEAKISFVKERTFDDFLTDFGRYYRFDYEIKYNNKKYLIEYNGRQHYGDTRWENAYEQSQASDTAKAEYCRRNNIPLIIIPYWDYDKLDVDYIINKINEVEHGTK